MARNSRRCAAAAGVPGPKNIPAIDSFTPMTLDYAKARLGWRIVTSRLTTILGL
jgi:hypothetical protein